MTETPTSDTVQPIMPPAWEPSGGMPALKITNVKAICTAPDGIRLVVVKVETSEPGLYGLGCATFTQRPLAVVTAVEQYLKPFVIGRDPDDIEDIWQAAFVSSYWRSGPVLNNAMSRRRQGALGHQGQAGRHARLPAVRRQGPPGAPTSTSTPPAATSRRSRTAPARSWRRATATSAARSRCPATPPTAAAATAATPRETGAAAVSPAAGHTPLGAAPVLPHRAEAVRAHADALGDEVELLHDVHERIPPIMAMQLAKDLEPFKLFFLEDPFAPEDNDYFRILRQQCVVPIAMGELFVNQHEYVPLIRDRLIDFIRVHISDIGGLTPARKLARPLRVLRRAHRLARPGRHLAGRPRRQPAARPVLAQLRHSGGEPVRRAHAGSLPRLPRDPRRRDVVQRAARPGHRRRRGAGREVPVPGAPDQRRLAGDPPPRRHGPEAVRPTTHLIPGRAPFASERRPSSWMHEPGLPRYS